MIDGGKKMKQDSNAQISSLMDDDLSQSEMRFLLKRLSHDDELSDTLARYHLIGACARSEAISLSLNDRIRAELEQDASQEKFTQPKNSIFMRLVGGTSVAAAAAMLTFVGISQLALNDSPPELNPTNPGSQIANTNQIPVDIERSGLTLAPVAATQTLATIQPSKVQLQNYLMRHSQFARKSGQQGMMPYIYVVAGKNEKLSDSERKKLDEKATKE